MDKKEQLTIQILYQLNFWNYKLYSLYYFTVKILMLYVYFTRFL